MEVVDPAIYVTSSPLFLSREPGPEKPRVPVTHIEQQTLKTNVFIYGRHNDL